MNIAENNLIKISIITVAYNDFSGLLRTEQSLLEQTDQDFEWIVVDGNSSDGTQEYFSGNTRANRFQSEKDDGIYDAMNKGAVVAQGKYCWFLNAGDVLETKRVIEDVKSHLRDVDIHYFAARFVFGSESSYVRLPRFPPSAVRYSVPANQQATLYRAELLRREPFDKRYKICGDYFISARLLGLGASWEISNTIVCKFMIGGRSTLAFKILITEAFHVQTKVLSISILEAALGAVRRFAAMTYVYLRFKYNSLR